MWVLRLIGAPGENLRRIVLMAVSSIILAVFAVGGPLSQITHALDGAWQGGNIRYDTQLYVAESTTEPPSPLDDNDPRDRPGQIAYTWLETLDNGDQRAHTIFIDSDIDRSVPTEGTLITYDYEPPSTYSNPSQPTDITIEADLAALTTDSADSSCSVAGIGWIVCPASSFIADGVDGAYALLRAFLEVPPITSDTETGIYAVWSIVRTIANVCFVIAFLIIIFSQVTNLGIGNYGIKSMLPRLITAAILVNISFWISALAVDISNLLGHSIHAVFENIRTNLPRNIEVTWGLLTTAILGGGAIVGTIAFTGSVAGSIAGLGFLLLSALLSVAFGVFVALVILAARQAILTILVIISPLAFVAFILPSTQGLFTRWRKSFTTLLLFFPLFGLLFGGSSLAGAAIMNNADDRMHIVLIGLTVQFIPLVITPLLIQFSSGLLGRIAGIAKGAQSGAISHAKSWARENAAYHKDRALGQRRAYSPFKLGARAMNRRRIAADARREGYKANADAMARGHRDRRTGEWRDRRNWVKSDIMRRQFNESQKLAQDRNEAQYTELTAFRAGDEAATNPYSVRDGWLRQKASSTTVAGRPLAKSNSEKLAADLADQRDTSYDIARDIAITSIRQHQANDKRSEHQNTDLKLSAELQEIATGIGSRDIMLAGVVTKERKDYADQVNAQDQIMKHFALESGQWQKLAMGSGPVTVTKNGLTHEFKVSNEYTREAAIEHQMAAGSAGQIRDIINESGAEVHEMRSDGTIEVRAGNNHEYRTTIQDAVIKNGVANKVPYVNDKSFDQIIKGAWKGRVSESANALREIVEGRLKIDNLVGANDGALEVIYELGDLKNSADPRDNYRYDYYKTMVLDMIPDPAERSRVAASFDATFDQKYDNIRKVAGQIMSNPMISQRASDSSQEVFKRYQK